MPEFEKTKPPAVVAAPALPIVNVRLLLKPLVANTAMVVALFAHAAAVPVPLALVAKVVAVAHAVAAVFVLVQY